MTSTTDVLVVGAGPVGLALATELGNRGVDVTIVDPAVTVDERRHPRARLLSLRSVQHLRRWKLSDTMREHSEFGPDWASDAYFMTSTTGHILYRFEDAFLSAPVETDLYPEPAIQIVQWQVEDVLRKHLAARPSVTTRFGERVASLTRAADGGVVAHVTGPDAQKTRIMARYAVGCDGGRSMVRRSQGFAMEGEHHLAHCLQVIFSSENFYEVTGLGPAVHYWILNEQFAGFIQTVSPHNRFLLSLHKLEEDAAISEGEATAILRTALGEKIDFAIEGFDPWHMRSEIATTYRRGSIFLVGDAARQHPTFGGHGMNVGLSDAVDLGWKLAAVIQGWAPDELLDTFTLERRPVGLRVLKVAAEQFGLSPRELVRPHIEDDGPVGDRVRRELGDVISAQKRGQFRSLGIQLGYAYADSPLVVPNGDTVPRWHVNDYTPVAVAGALAPHAWIGQRSLYDDFGPWFTVLGFGPAAEAEVRRIADGAARRGIDAEVLLVDDESAAAKYARRLAIVRPDQHLAWVGDDPPVNVDDVWRTVVGLNLATTPHSGRG